jgi:phospholipid/cholesterol/gamma-HCH transport system ATP-binding protein
MMRSSIIDIDHLSTRFGAHVVHDNISLRVYAGEILGLVGSSGSGKTMLTRQMLGLGTPCAGRIAVFGKRLQEMDAADAKRMHDRIGVLFQGGALFSALNVHDNIALPLRELRLLDEDTINELVCMKLAMVGLETEVASLMPAALSGGMVKRVALARALALEPELLFLDEPTSGLDPIASDGFVKLVAALRRELEFTVVMVTHDLGMLRELCDRVAVLAERRLVALGSLDDVLESPHPFVRKFFYGGRTRHLFDAQTKPLLEMTG